MSSGMSKYNSQRAQEVKRRGPFEDLNKTPSVGDKLAYFEQAIETTRQKLADANAAGDKKRVAKLEESLDNLQGTYTGLLQGKQK